jgi:hypothetical protein
MVMILGIVSLFMGGVGLILGPMAWIMGRNDLREMDSGRMDESGRSNTNVGRICGMIATGLQCTFMLCCVGRFIMVGMMFTSSFGSANSRNTFAQVQAEMQKAQFDAQKARVDAQQAAADERMRQIQEAQERAKQVLLENKDKNKNADPPVGRPNPPPEPEPKEPENREPGTIELLPYIDLNRDIVKGKWLKEGKVLQCDDTNFAPRVQIRYEPPEEYDLIVQFSQPKLRHPIAVMLPNRNGGTVILKVGMRNGNDFQLSTNRKEVKTPNLLKPNIAHTIAVQVRRNWIRALLDNRELVRLKSDLKNLTVDNWNKMPDPRFLGVGCDDPTSFYVIRVTEIGGVGKKR